MHPEPSTLHQKLQQYIKNKNQASTSQGNILQNPSNSHKTDNLDAQTISLEKRKVGGSYSHYSGGEGMSRGLTSDGELVDSSGRKIKTETLSQTAAMASSSSGTADMTFSSHVTSDMASYSTGGRAKSVIGSCGSRDILET